MATVGRPPKYKSVDEIKIKIAEYFKACEGEYLKDSESNIVLDKWNKPIVINAKPPTITGLALALGFNSRQSLLNYQGKKEFMDTITHAKLLVEEYAETRLYDRDGVNGAKFSLANNFKWQEHPQTEIADTVKEAPQLMKALEDDSSNDIQ